MTSLSTEVHGRVDRPPAADAAIVQTASDGTPRAIADAARPAVVDAAHVGDIVGAFGRIRRDATGMGRSRWQRLRALLVIIGPGLIVMVGDNDAGGVATYAQAGQNYGMNLLWTLVLMIPVLYVNQEMVLRLGAVTRVGHARLIFARFGKFWGAFSVGDLLILNALTIVTEFIGVSLALGYLGCPKTIAIPAAAVLLFGVVAGGSFRRWEQLMFVLIAANVVIIPMALLVHPSFGTSARGLIPSLPGEPDSIVLMLIMAIVGTTVAPWQLFFQQSNIVDKRITPRWIRYGRADLIIGIVGVIGGAVGLMTAAAFGLGGTPAEGKFTDAGDVAFHLSDHVGHTVGVLFAIVLLDASLIGANVVALSTTYALGDALGKPHSLHWKVTEAPLFYGIYAALLAVSAAVAFSPDHVLGIITQGVQALAGVLLPSATVFLVLLCNDRPVMGPWVNTFRQNAIAWMIVWSLIVLSLMLTAVTFFPNLSTPTLVSGLVIGAVIGIFGAAIVFAVGWYADRRELEDTVPLGALSLDELEELDELSKLTGRERKALRDKIRASWTTPSLATLPRPVMSPVRRAGLFTLRGYLLLAGVLVVVKVLEAGLT
ncbi:NRAMP family divalent metal transporter [Mycobacterium xenopi]|uniref:Manganese transporter n=2 Tax=Mycobacterium xenopi TaxID=1789 RepID=A0AAD1H1N5_MYCXE|nr:NRAMP family divalent metal transporter [Mycobacterium xenopi]EID14187.1 membrane transport protein [Mycobacterium xenopi RIVM700367]MDA3640125.1 divalent metal cation transporter [Mycobacterium xenopi]MDA3660100.1 divalent metal cation transporter [Mycobacterium xenopi]MDA3664766.1 divalent metal cation transporter [Mycobacterium xenopi]ORX19538.1 manganese transporter [Mycobacterium xenopi]